MKKTILCLLLLATGCAITNQSNAVKQTTSTNHNSPPVYYTGNNESTANSINNDVPEYFTGNDAPVARSMNNEK